MTRRQALVPEHEVAEVFADFGPGRASEALAAIRSTAEAHGSGCPCAVCRYVHGEAGER